MLHDDFGTPIDKAEESYIKTLTLLTGGFVGSSGGDDVRIQWQCGDRDLRLVVYADKNYLYYQNGDTEHGVIQNVDAETIRQWLVWLTASHPATGERGVDATIG